MITIDPSTITDAMRAVNLDIAVTIAHEAQMIYGKEVPSNSIAISLSDHGEFGFALSLSITAEQLLEAGVDINNARLFHISVDGVITEKPDYFVINDDGSITITISHASGYVLTEENLLPDVIIPMDAELPAEMAGTPETTDIITEAPTVTDTIIESIERNRNSLARILIALGSIVLIGCLIVVIVRRKGKATA